MTDDATLEVITTELDRSLHIVAGAGTGKTYSLVQRVLSLVSTRKRSLADLAIITFSNAAAAELRERIRTKLEEQPEGSLARAAAAEIDQATISTLHGFAQSILADHPLEAGLPPHFEVLDEIAASVEFDAWWRRTSDEIYADPRLESHLLTLSALGVTPTKLRPFAQLLTADADRIPAEEPPIPSPRPLDDQAFAPVQAALGAAIELAPHCTDPQDRLLNHLHEVAAVHAELGGGDPYELLVRIASAKLTCSDGQKPSWNGMKPAVGEHLKKAESAREDLLQAVVAPAVSAVVGRIATAVRTAAQERRREGRLTFHDLLVCARDLVVANPEVRAALAARYPFVLLDEFQDTDPLQIELAVRIAAADPARDAPSWTAVRTRTDALFIVGDPKQSIYRFRRADISLYAAVQSHLDTATLRLGHNRRSRPGIVSWVNAAIAPLMGKEADRDLQPEYAPLDPHRLADPEHPIPVRSIGGPLTDANADTVRTTEAGALAAAVAEITRSGWTVEPRHGKPRPARLDDIAVLLPTRAVLPYLQRAFDQADIPLRIESQSLLFATEEIQDLTSVLAAIDDPADPLALVAALRAPAFGCSDVELAQYADAGGRWSIFASAPEPLDADHAVARALAVLRGFHLAAPTRTPSETVEAVIEDRRLLELALAHRRPRDRWRRIRYIADAARAFEERGSTRLRDFVSWLQDQREDRARVNEAVAPEPDDHAVRVLTIHGSKGLEFPIVLLAGLGTPPRTSADPLRFGASGPVARVRVRYGGKREFCSTGDFDAIAERDKRADHAEAVRLLYVAATRARDHLVVSVHHAAKGVPNSFAARLRALDTETPLPWAAWKPEAGPADGGRSDTEAPHGALAISAADQQRWWEHRARAVQATRRVPRVSATSIASALATEAGNDGEGEAGAESQEESNDRPAWRRGRAGTAIGRAVHAVLQTVDLTDPRIDGAVRAQAHAEGVPDRADEIARLVEAVLASPALRAAREHRSWREVPVTATVDGVRVEGYLDLLVDGADGLEIIDYKTDAVGTDAEVDAAVARYRPQGAAYALALETALGRPVARMTFVFARGRAGATERTIDDLGGAVAELRARLPELAP